MLAGFLLSAGAPPLNSELRAGFNMLLGFAHDDGFFTELKVGALDSPDLKFGVGYSWE